jgi:pyrroline-5-carboxylate reductase
MVLKTNEHPASMKDAVTSPGGTTACGIHKLEELGFRNSIMSAVEAGTLKSKSLTE